MLNHQPHIFTTPSKPQMLIQVHREGVDKLFVLIDLKAQLIKDHKTTYIESVEKMIVAQKVLNRIYDKAIWEYQAKHNVKMRKYLGL